MAAHARVAFISFGHIYPKFLYPGGELKKDCSFPCKRMPNLKVYRRLNWYNPLSWFYEGLFTRAELLHAQWWSMPLMPIYAVVAGLFKLRRKKIVFTVHNVISHEESHLFSWVSKLLFKLGDHFIVHTARNSHQMQSLYGVAEDIISIIPHGRLDFQVNNDADRRGIRDSMGYRPNNRVVLLFGAIRPYKGVDTAIRAFAVIHRNIPEARLLIAGKLWEDWAPYQRLIDRCGIAEVVKTDLQYIPSANVHRYFCAADLTVLPYHNFDSQSGVGSAALAFNTPLVVSDVGGLPELVPDSRCVVPPKNPEALASAVTTLLTNPAIIEELAEKMKHLNDKFSWARIAETTMDVYRSVAPDFCRTQMSRGKF
jgi:glycosyltransferase involved in cell wall biosynthesis